MTETIVILSSRGWSDQSGDRLEDRLGRKVTVFGHDVPDLYSRIAEENPRWVFVPHWSKIIERDIWTEWEVVVFHMTDLPFGRGGSPLQNLIVRGVKETVVSAFRCSEGIDEGPIYLKSPLSLEGSAREIFFRADGVIKEMIIEIVETRPIPRVQSGEPTFFTRRSPEQSELNITDSLTTWFDRIRMVDAPGYPKAYLSIEDKVMTFSNVKYSGTKLTAEVAITNKDC